ncbi:hypothetical protein AYI69_g4599 [Smittium culicis]|uniref:Uncharacterized protein n=1 Tax=Smittium culicis TaxID=133412 RepID=A0A1R1YC71_9FUNG|nr:hypothetical protein AYI69_g4599 [Smittium culicis]
MVEDFSNIDLESADFDTIWSLLDESGKTEFKELFVNFNPSSDRDIIINQALKKFNPWWTAPIEPKIEILDDLPAKTNHHNSGNENVDLFELDDYDDEKNAELQASYDKRPTLLSDIKEYNLITKVRPNPLVFNQLVGIM